jgi:hypothetical protein
MAHHLVRTSGVVIGLLSVASFAAAYIHFPPMTLEKMCNRSHQVRVLKVEKLDKDLGVVIFKSHETLKGGKSVIAEAKHVIRPESDGAKPILNWLAPDKSVVMFSLEAVGGNAGIGYVFIDENCYSVDYNHKGKYWYFLRAEPELAACYFGSVSKLRELAKDILDGKSVNVPTKPAAKSDNEKRFKEINDGLTKNRQP